MPDSKLTDLTEATSVEDTDLLYVVTDPTGSATSKKLQVGNLPSGSGLSVTISGAWIVEEAYDWDTILADLDTAGLLPAWPSGGATDWYASQEVYLFCQGVTLFVQLFWSAGETSWELQTGDSYLDLCELYPQPSVGQTWSVTALSIDYGMLG